MGVVRAARRRSDRAPVAVKLLSKQLLDECPLAAQRFLREAKTLARLSLSSPHVVRVFDVGLTDESVPFLVMERLHGRTARDLVRQSPQRQVPVRVAVEVMSQTAVAIGVAHAEGIIHRDITLSNIFLAETATASGSPWQVKVLDFGIARAIQPRADELSSSMTATMTAMGYIHGTRPFMAPELLRGERTFSAESDVFSLGVCLYILVTGRHPFSATLADRHEPGGRSLSDRIRCGRHATPPSAYRPELSRELSAIILRCLAPRKNQRFEDAEALALALDRLGELTHESNEAAPPSAQSSTKLLRVGNEAKTMIMVGSPATPTRRPPSPAPRMVPPAAPVSRTVPSMCGRSSTLEPWWALTVGEHVIDARLPLASLVLIAVFFFSAMVAYGVRRGLCTTLGCSTGTKLVKVATTDTARLGGAGDITIMSGEHSHRIRTTKLLHQPVASFWEWETTRQVLFER